MQRAISTGRLLLSEGAASKHVRGFSLIELVIAVVVLSVASMATWRSFEHSGHAIAGQAPRFIARQVALNRAAELRHYGLATARALPERVPMGMWTWTVSLSESEARNGLVAVEIAVSAPAQPGQRLTAFVSFDGRTP